MTGTEIGIVLLVLAVVLAVIAVILGRRTRRQVDQIREGTAAPALDLTHPRPRVAGFHVRGTEAAVSFDVPLPEGEVDEVLSDLLVGEAVEVVREKRHTLPIDQVTTVVALAGTEGEPREVGRLKLTTPGELPPPVPGPAMLHFSRIGFDPIEQEFSAEGSEEAPGLAERPSTDELRPIGSELRIPKAVDTGLRAQGIDPETMSAGELVRGMLSLFGYQIVPGMADGTYIASKGGQRTFLREDRYQPGEYPAMDDTELRSFMVEFASSGTDRGLLVTDRYAPFGIHDLERREPRVRYVTRERLQKFVDAMAME